MCDFYADRKKYKFFNRIVHWRLHVHKIFHTCRAPRVLFIAKVWRGRAAENFERIAKNLKFFALVRAKALTVFTSGGARSRSNIHLLGHSLAVPQPF